MRPQTKKHILYCDECHDLIMPGQGFYSVGGRLICTICWGDAPVPAQDTEAAND